MTDELPAYTFPVTAEELLAPFADLSYEKREDGRWVVLATPTKDVGGKPEIIGEGDTREAAEAAAVELALAMRGFATLATGLSALLGRVLNQEMEDVTPLPPVALRGQPVAALPGDFGWRIVFDVRADGSFDWHTYDATGRELLRAGTADAWDDAKLAAILDLLPPSGER